MGKEKYQTQIAELFKKSPVVSYRSIEKIVKNKGNVKQYVKKIIHNLLIKGKIKRLTKGFYTTRNESSLIVFAFQPAYLGLQDALSLYNLWEQETIPIIITSRNIRQGIRKVFGQNVLIRRIDKKLIFGIEHHLEGDAALPYSDIEKTFIDMAYYNENIDESVLKEIKKRLIKEKLNSYLKNFPKKIKEKVESLL